MDVIDLRSNDKKVEALPEAKILKSKESKRDKDEISWEAPDFYDNSQKRYLRIVILVLLVGSGAMFIFTDDLLTSIFLIMASFVLFLSGNKKTKAKRIIIDNQGILVGENGFLYSELRSFWIDYSPDENKELSLQAKKWYIPYIKMSLENQNPLEIRARLINFIPEKEHERSIADIVSKKLGL